mmetsp:Transcript_41396/g.131661  ORF Transcript_41396/g.131661 Transcript_41396/m.131661 type:complete len:131 (-) Transcript_41396:32-424(-)
MAMEAVVPTLNTMEQLKHNACSIGALPTADVLEGLEGSPSEPDSDLEAYFQPETQRGYLLQYGENALAEHELEDSDDDADDSTDAAPEERVDFMDQLPSLEEILHGRPEAVGSSSCAPRTWGNAFGHSRE